jgi:hypothetical protein
MKKPGKRSTLSAPANLPQPHDLEIEKALLYAFILDNKLLVSIDIAKNDFFLEKHGDIYFAMYQLKEENIGVDFVTLGHKLRELDLFASIGGPDYLAELQESGASSAMANEYAQLLVELSMRRRIMNLGMNLAQSAASDGLVGNIVSEAREELKSIDTVLFGSGRSIASQVEDWVQVTTGNFMVTDVYKDLGIVTPSNKKAILTHLNRMEKKGIVTKCGEKRGCWRGVPLDMERIDLDFKDEDEDEYSLFWPGALPMHEYVKFYPKQLIIIQGEPQTGKTALMLNMAYLNLQAGVVPRIDYFNSEGGQQEFKLRLKDYSITHQVDYDTWKNPKFHVWERSQDFAEVINPDGLNIIDFLEMTEEFYLIGKYLTHIWRRLNKGVAIVGLQKDPGKTYAKGGQQVMEKPRLIISLMLGGKAQVIKAKCPRFKGQIIDRKIFHYRLFDGCKFVAKTAPVAAPILDRKGEVHEFKPKDK